MGQQHQRRKRRRRYQKVDIPIISLSTITIILLFVWGGLYWRESTEKALTNHTNINEQPLEIGKTIDSSGGIVNDPGVVSEMSLLPEEAQSTVGMNTNTDGPTPIDSDPLIPTKV